MTTPHIKNMGASVRQRLLNQAKITKRPFAEVLQYFAMERFLYRLSVSPHADKFLLKGALLLSAWQAPISRPTRDIDLLGKTDNSVDAIVQLMTEIGQSDVIDDGMNFVLDSFSGAAIREDADYSGVRVSFIGLLDRARVPMQIDIGFGDVVTPGPELVTYPTVLDFPPPVLSGYSRETVIAEKLQALVHLRMLNTRMKDYFDLWLLSGQTELNKETLCLAIERTFWTRHSPIDRDPIGLSVEFGTDATKQAQWKAFLQRSEIRNAPESLSQVVEELKTFFEPLLNALSAKES